MALAFWSLKHAPKFIAFFVDRSDHQPHRYPNINERRSNSNFVGSPTGKSPGLAPLTILSIKAASRRKMS